MTIDSSHSLRRLSLAGRIGVAMIVAFMLLCLSPNRATAQKLRLGNEEYGVRSRVGFLGGETVGRLESLTHFEVMPYLRTPEGMLFGDARLYFSDGEVGGNIGVGYRELIPELNRIFGGILWYDIDNLSGEQAQQLTISLETYGTMIDGLANFYIPLGDNDVGSVRATNERFVDNRLIYDQIGTVGDVMTGGDVQIGVLLPGQLAENTQLRAFLGAYHYTGDTVDDITGVMARLEGTFFDIVDGQLKITDDDTFGSNLLVGFSVGLNRSYRSSKWRSGERDPINRYPTRQYNAVIVQGDVTQTGVVARNPETGNAYSFTHASGNASGALLGTAENPFDNLQAALGENSDFYIVHGDSVFTGDDAEVALGNGDTVLGNYSGYQHAIQADRVGTVILPTIVANSDAPILRGTDQNTVTMASNSEFRGFTIENSDRNGIVFDGVDNAVVSNVTILDAARNGVRVRNISGSVSVLDTSVTTSGLSALAIEDITGEVLVTGDFANDSGEALILEDIGEDATVDLTGASFSNDTGNGLALNRVSGNVSLSAVSLLNSSANGINIDGGSGTIRFEGETVIEGATGDAIRVHNSDATIEFDSLTIKDANGVGISLFGNANTASFTVNELTSITGSSQGIRIENNEGTATFNNVEIDARTEQGIYIDNTEGQVSFLRAVDIGNSEDSTASAIDIRNSSADILFLGQTSITEATGDPAVNLADNSGGTGFVDLQVTNEDGSGLVARSAGLLRINEGSVSSENGPAFDIEDTETAIELTSISVLDGSVGIRLVDHSGSFIVNGITGSADSGGFIRGSSTGLLLENAGVVGVRYVNFTETGRAFVADDAERLSVWNGSIRNSSIGVGSIANVNTLEFVESTFADNASGLTLLANQDEAYAWQLSSVSMDGDDQLLSVASSGEAEVGLIIEDSGFSSNLASGSLLDIFASDRLAVRISGNNIISSGSNATLINLVTNSTNELAQLSMFDNLLETSGSSATGLNLQTAGPSELLIDSNTITFAADRGQGIVFNLAGSAELGLYSNFIDDNFDGATAVLFESVVGPSRLEIIGNEFQFENLGGLADRGFIFEDISGDVNLLGTVNNAVDNASTPVFVPSGRTTGSFIVNGVAVPQ